MYASILPNNLTVGISFCMFLVITPNNWAALIDKYPLNSLKDASPMPLNTFPSLLKSQVVTGKLFNSVDSPFWLSLDSSVDCIAISKPYTTFSSTKSPFKSPGQPKVSASSSIVTFSPSVVVAFELIIPTHAGTVTSLWSPLFTNKSVCDCTLLIPNTEGLLRPFNASDCISFDASYIM